LVDEDEAMNSCTEQQPGQSNQHIEI